MAFFMVFFLLKICGRVLAKAWMEVALQAGVLRIEKNWRLSVQVMIETGLSKYVADVLTALRNSQ